MQHALEIRLRLHIDETELAPGETPREAAERLLREIMTVDDKLLDMRVCGWTWSSVPVNASERAHEG
jgi:hypothetical protein